MTHKLLTYIVISLLLLFSAGSSLAQSIDLNNKIQTLCARGDSALLQNDMSLAEKFYTTACAYTDTLTLCATKKITTGKFVFKRLKIAQVFFAYEKLGSVYRLSGNISQAEQLYNKSLTQRQLVFNKHSFYRIYPYALLGQLHLEEGETGKALDYLGQASKLLDRAVSNTNFDLLRQQVYALHFEASLKKKNAKEAWKYLQRYYFALNTVSPTNEQLATAFERKARYYLFTGNYGQAQLYLSKAESKLSHARSIFSEAEIKVYRTQAIYYWSLNRRDSAAIVFEKLLNSYENNIRKNFPSMSEQGREQFYITLKSDFDLFNSFVIVGMKAGETNSHLLEILYNTQLFTKAMLLNELAKTKHAILTAGNKELFSKIKQWERNKNRVSYLYYYNKRKAQPEIEELEHQIDQLEKEINAQTSLLRELGKEVRWQQVRDVLKSGEAAVEIVRAKPYNPASFMNTSSSVNDSIDYIMLIVKPGSSAPEGFLMNDGKNMEERYLPFYRNCILHKLHDDLSYKHLWKPLGDKLQGVSTAFLSCDGIYNQINLNTLKNPENGNYVLDEINLEFVTNTKDLLIPGTIRTDSTAWLLGRAVYASPEKKSADSSKLSMSGFADLPGTQEEVENIAKILSTGHWKVNTFLLEAASEERLKAIKSVETIHIATHGFFNNDDQQINAMINSGIILSKDSAEDGILTAYEASNLALDSTQLVVLSACETGLGEIKNGEGVYGLQRGLIVAGARNILMSLWKVNDEATAKLMTDFYEAWLKGVEVHQAFRQAQMELRKNYPNPFYWGAFILLGN